MWPMPPPGRPRHAWLLGTSLRRWALRRLLRRALPYLGDPERIVDLGAGTAADAEELLALLPRRAGRRVLLVDAQRAMIARGGPGTAGGGPLGAAGRWVLGDVTRLPLPDGCADVVLSVGMLCCVAPGHVEEAVRESGRILRPGGVLVLGVPRWRGAADERATAASGLLRRAGGRPGHAVFQKRLEGLPASGGAAPVGPARG